MSGKEVACYQEEDGESHRKPRRTRGKGKGKGKEKEKEEPGSDFYRVKRKMTDDELDRYLKKLEESEGYDVECPPNIVACGGIGELEPDEYDGCLIDAMASRAINEYNEANGTQLLFEKVEKVNQGMSEDGLKFYITFHVLDQNDRAQPNKVFQAQVVETFQGAGHLVHQVRPKPAVKTSKKGRRRRHTADA